MASSPVDFHFAMDDNFSGRLANIQAAADRLGVAVTRVADQQAHPFDRIEDFGTGELQRWEGDDA